MEIEPLQRYLKLIEQGNSTIAERKAILIKERENLIAKKEAIETSLKRLDYKIANYEKIFGTKEEKQ
jgi:hypothetical protein